MKENELLKIDQVDASESFNNFNQSFAQLSSENLETKILLQNEILIKQNEYLSKKVMDLEKRWEEQLFRQLDFILEQEEFVLRLEDYASISEAKGSFDSLEFEKLREEYHQMQTSFDSFKRSKFGKVAVKYWKLMKFLRRK